MRYLSVCSGIEAASVAWHHLGWTPVGFSEIEPFPSAVLAHRFPAVPNYGDMTKFEEWPIEPGTIDVLVGGTPCQSFSVAGLRKGLADPRGNLMLTYLAIAARLKPRWVVWENVPGVLSSNGGRDFGTFLGALGQLGYGWAYRVLDAQYLRVGRWPRAVPQRRRRVFVVGCLGDWTAAAEAVLIPEGMRRYIEASGKTRKGAAPDAEGGVGGDGWPAKVASTLNHAFGDKLGLEDQHALHGAPLFVPEAVGALTAKGPIGMGALEVDANHYIPQGGCWWDGSDRAGTLTKQNAGGGQRMPDKGNFGAVLQPTEVSGTIAARFGQSRNNHEECVVQPTAGTLGNRGLRSHTELDGHGAYIPVAFSQNQREEVREVEVPGALAAEPGTHQQTFIAQPVPYDLFQITAPVNRQNRKPGDPCHTLARDNAAHAAVAFNFQGGSQQDQILTGDAVCPALDHASNSHGGHHQPKVAQIIAPSLTATNDPSRSPQSSEVTQQVAAVHASTMTVRRLSARECERLQGFPDDWTLIPWRGKPAEQCPDGPRYKALGNSMACNCMAWIGERIASHDAKRRVD